MYGDIPDIHWRAIPMSHLRFHPLFIPLPIPSTIARRKLQSLEDVKYFRQSSWQWDLLHKGRCTTSIAAPALGLLEPKAAAELGIPRSLQHGCMTAFNRLSNNEALRTIEDMNEVLCVDNYESIENERDVNCDVWKRIKSNKSGRANGNHYPFAAKYKPTFTKKEMRRRRRDTTNYISTIPPSQLMRIRMNWGNTQEATAILTALNYFSKQDPGLKVKEVGMCGAGLEMNTTNSVDKNNTGVDDPGLIIGASPDAVIEYSNGTLEVLEVKNHCPFVPNIRMKTSKKHGGKKGALNSCKYRIRVLSIDPCILPAYIPQLMMEMLCVGNNCRSAIMVRQTATNGAIILRLHRDDEWIKEMIYWLQKFMTNYVNKGISPEQNFFWDDHDNNNNDESLKRYRNFVEWTNDLSKKIDVVERISNSSIQRVRGDEDLPLPLFLD